MRSKSGVIKDQRGQALVEAVLLLSMGMLILAFAMNQLREKKFLQTLVASPWGKLSGMIECGVWGPCGTGMHPGATNRNLSLDPTAQQN